MVNHRDNAGEFLPMLSLEDEDKNIAEEYEDVLPLIALKNTVLFPGVVIPITIGRDKSLAALKKADKGTKNIAVVTQRDLNVEEPEAADLYKIGVVAKLMKVLKMPDGSTTAILQGRKKIFVEDFTKHEPHFEVKAFFIEEVVPEDDMEFDAMHSSIIETARRIIELSPQIPNEAMVMLQNIKSPAYLFNFIASNLNVNALAKQELLEIGNLKEKGSKILEHLNQEIQMLQIKDQIESKVRGDIDKQQRDYYLNQQLRTIQEELGGNPQDIELNELERKAQEKEWPKEIAAHFAKEIQKARRINPQIAEYSVTLNYLETLLDLPWSAYTKDNFNLANVKKVLDDDHYGLDDIKDRILEHLAVLKLRKDMKAPILCLVGPPGVGKTSLGRSIARALKRNFVRMSLGGLHDESEIRGHRKTYIGAMPGRIIKALKKTGSSNPVFILDEIDKLGSDHRGDPSSALLEALDPEQNFAFYDNYLEVDYDLSKVLFIATANSLNSIQPALLDRMEIIEVSGYSTEEKIEIAKKHLVPKQKKENGLEAKDVSLEDEVLEKIITDYTRESGVRNLERTIGSVMRHIAVKKASNEKYNKKPTAEETEKILGPIRFLGEKYSVESLPGVAVGLAWTKVGGDILYIEASTSKGKGKLTLTGNLGDVMKESATTALSFIKANASKLEIDADVFDNTDIHIHIPEGAIPKDGPSAGITMLTAIVSALKGKPVKPHLAMTGEITLRGKVLPVGGIKEKILAAKRSGMKEVMLCRENQRHVEQINPDFIKDVQFIYVDTMYSVIEQGIGVRD
ncbi:MAG: endopeptidase La [Saprospiraceae bacterium]|nr:endopeptidase La [Saprospiraceae bacterium]